MHDFSSDFGNYKIDLANSNAACYANYKNYLDNYVENYKKNLADCTFPEGRSPPQSDESITRLSQIITDVTFSAEILLTLFILYIFSPVGTRIQNFLGRKAIMGFKLNNLQTIEMTEYSSEKEHTNFVFRRINVAYHSA
ncbi:PIR Superfamily Protein [Plasmodium ovale curtisi]|uniref:PIR Superfamily Protein n=1 Tax=Plasmodium ovale curtisi TaxID=864141 RepID=A0A1A8WQ49_PLAOA|nr:PIR Superfamily Protein [Plasmodium ovale curtisi]